MAAGFLGLAGLPLPAAPGLAAPIRAARNPVWTGEDNLRDPAVLPVEGGYRIFYSRLTGTNWSSPDSWTVCSAFTPDFTRFDQIKPVSPTGHASPGDVVRWHGRWILPYQSYPAQPTRLCFSESPDLQSWSAPRVFLAEAADLPWNSYHRVIDPTLVADGDTLHCYFVGSADVAGADGRKLRANLLGHAVTRDPTLAKWDILAKDKPLLGVSERAPDGVENIMIFRTGDHWTMLFSEGLATQHLASATSTDLADWKVGPPLDLPKQEWMAVKHGAPFVWAEGDRWKMILMGENKNRHTSFGLLDSPDGLHWAPLPETPPPAPAKP